MKDLIFFPSVTDDATYFHYVMPQITRSGASKIRQQLFNMHTYAEADRGEGDSKL